MPRVGILGGGQLGRMLALAGYPLDIRCTVLDPASDACASDVTEAIVGGYDDPEALAQLARLSDVATYEFENVPVDAVRDLAERIQVFPPPGSLEVSQDRLAEKSLFEKVGLETAAYAAVDSLSNLTDALDRVGTPAVLKTRRLGYDGKGQAMIQEALLAEDAWRSVGEVPSILEAFVAFDRELSMVAVRGRDGDSRFYPLVENLHRDGILRTTKAPAPRLSVGLQGLAEGYARAIMAEVAHVGVLAVELFQVGDRLLANEMAPRVHNSGHWTIEGAETSQFENHLRAVTGMPLGSTTPRGMAAMVNLIGSCPDIAAAAAIDGAHVHLYGKEPRPGRKLGHVTVRAEDPQTLESAFLQVKGLLDPASR